MPMPPTADAIIISLRFIPFFHCHVLRPRHAFCLPAYRRDLAGDNKCHDVTDLSFPDKTAAPNAIHGADRCRLPIFADAADP
jgi:hypothetical protein